MAIEQLTTEQFIQDIRDSAPKTCVYFLDGPGRGMPRFYFKVQKEPPCNVAKVSLDEIIHLNSGFGSLRSWLTGFTIYKTDDQQLIKLFEEIRHDL